jgi:ABC-type transport system substrate-binding protein
MGSISWFQDCTTGALRQILSLLLTTVAICGCKPAMHELPRQGGVLLNPPLDLPLNGYDPAVVSHISDDVLAQQLFDGLLQYRPKTFELGPALAKQWRTPDGGKTWVFHLRDNAFFNDDACFAHGRGRLVTAEDVKYSLERIISWREDEYTWRVLSDIVGADDFRRGRSTAARGIRVLGPRKLEIELSKPSRQFLHRLASARGYVVPREAVDLYGKRFRVHPVGSGPFRFVRVDLQRQEIHLVRNAKYWETDSQGNRLPYVAEIRCFGRTSDDGVSVPSVDGRIISCIPAWTEDWQARIDAYNRAHPQNPLRIFETPIASTIFYSFRMDAETPYARNKLLRQAIAFALDIGPASIGAGEVIPAKSLVPPGLFGYQSPVRGYTFDLQKAAGLLSAAGYPKGEGLPPLKMNSLESSGGVFKKLHADFASLGIDFETEFLPKPEHFVAAVSGRLEFFRDGWICDYPDALDLFQRFHSSSPNNASRYTNAEYDRLFELASKETDRKRLFKLYSRMEEILLDDCPAIYQIHEIYRVAIPARVHNLELSINPIRMRFLKYVWIEQGPNPGPEGQQLEISSKD